MVDLKLELVFMVNPNILLWMSMWRALLKITFFLIKYTVFVIFNKLLDNVDFVSSGKRSLTW